MKNNKGFIATTLIYSFLLLFATLVTVIISNYNYYRNTLNKYNKSINTALNARINDKYITLYNEIGNSDFEKNNSWNLSNAYYSNPDNKETKKGGLRSLKFPNSTATVTSNKFNCYANRYYYVSYYVFTNGNVGNGTGNIGLFSENNSLIAGEPIIFVVVNSENDYNLNWKKKYYLGKSGYTGQCQFRVNYSNNISNTIMHIDNVLVVDVTDIIKKSGVNGSDTLNISTSDQDKFLENFSNDTKASKINYFSDYSVYSMDNLFINWN